MVKAIETTPMTYEEVVRCHGKPVRYERTDTGETGYGIVAVRQFGDLIWIHTGIQAIISHIHKEPNARAPLKLYPVLLTEAYRAG